MTYGYSVRLQERNREADQTLLGVRLGKTCIKNKVPVAEAARLLGVSRQTIYNWFCGGSSPQASARDAVVRFMGSFPPLL